MLVKMDRNEFRQKVSVCKSLHVLCGVEVPFPVLTAHLCDFGLVILLAEPMLPNNYNELVILFLSGL